MSGTINRNLGALITRTAASAGGNGDDITQNWHKGILVIINVSAITGTSPTYTVTIQGKDTVSGQYYTILASAAINATGTTVLRVYPGLPATANASANDLVPTVFRVIDSIGGTGPSVTATVSATTYA